MPASKNFYKILQIDPSAEPEVIEGAYKRLINKYHPNHNKTANATETTQLINEAYDVLRDPQKRKAYDATRKYQSSQSKTSNSANNFDAERERKRREQAEWDVYEARQQAEEERENAAYEREQRKQAEAAAKRAEIRKDVYTDTITFVRKAAAYFNQNRPILYVCIFILLVIILNRPISKAFDLAIQVVQVVVEPTSVPAGPAPILIFSTVVPTMPPKKAILRSYHQQPQPL